MSLTVHRRPVLTMASIIAIAIAVAVSAPERARAQDDPPPEHSVIKPMTGATPSVASTFEEFGRLTVTYRAGARSVREEVEGQREVLP